MKKNDAINDIIAPDVKIKIRKTRKSFFDYFLESSNSAFANKVNSCFPSFYAFKKYCSLLKKQDEEDLVYNYYKYVNEINSSLKNYMNRNDLIEFCDNFLDHGLDKLIVPDKFPKNTDEKGIITLKFIKNPTEWKLYYFKLPDQNNFKAFLLRDSKCLSDMFNVSEIVNNFVDNKISNKKFVEKILQEITTLNYPRRNLDKNISPCIVCGRKEKNPYYKLHLCFYCWVICEYLNANLGLKISSIERFVKKCKHEFDGGKSDLKKYFNSRIYSSRENPRFPLTDTHIEYCLKKMFEE